MKVLPAVIGNVIVSVLALNGAYWYTDDALWSVTAAICASSLWVALAVKTRGRQA